VPLRGLKQHATIAILLLSANRVVSVERLADDPIAPALPICRHEPGRYPNAPTAEPDVRTRVDLVWGVEHSLETSAKAQAVWQLWADVDRWPEWNAGVEQIELRGPFAVGSTILMRPPGEEPVELRITEAVEPELFIDEADGGDFVVRTTHRVEAVANERSRISYRMEITGPAAEAVGPEIGPEISGDFPQVLAALAARAEGRA